MPSLARHSETRELGLRHPAFSRLRLWCAAGQRPGWITLAVTSALFALALYDAEDFACTIAEPCAVAPLGLTSIGVLAAIPIAGFVNRFTTRFLTTLFVTLAYAQFAVEPEPGAWLLGVLDMIFLFIVWLITYKPEAVSGLVDHPVVAVRKPPKPTGRAPLIRPGRAIAGAMLALIAIACLVKFALDQGAGERRQAEATVVAGKIFHVGEYAVDVFVPDRGVVEVDVLEPTVFDIGDQFPMWVNDDGFAQPVSEPFDVTGWLFWSGLAGGAAIALGWQTISHTRARRRLFRHPQTVRDAVARTERDKIVISTPDPLVTLEVRPHRPLRQVGAIKAKLYGAPVDGAWCAIQVGREVVAPIAPAIVRERRK